MTTFLILLAVVVVVAVVVVIVQRRAKAQASVLRANAADHRADAEATRKAASLQESHANELAATARRQLADAERELKAATVKREVAADLTTRADSIDPDLPVQNDAAPANDTSTEGSPS